MSQITVNGANLVLKYYNAVPVVTFEEIDMVHQRSSGSARRNFTNNRDHFIEGVDYFLISLEDYRDRYDHNYLKGGGNPNLRKTLLTETGYYLLAKTFNDKLSWDIQRALVLNYFNSKEKEASIYEYLRQVVDLLESQANAIDTLTKRQDVIEERISETKQLQLELFEEPKEQVKLFTNTELAMRFGFYSVSKHPHQKLMKAVAYQAGLKVHLHENYEDEFIKIEKRLENEQVGLVSFAIYYKPKAVERINKWFEDNKNFAYFENFYMKNSRHGKAGELKNRGYRIGKMNYYIA